MWQSPGVASERIYVIAFADTFVLRLSNIHDSVIDIYLFTERQNHGMIVMIVA